MSYRCRWFEYLCYRPLMEKYWVEDPNRLKSPKTKAYRPRLSANYLSEKIGIEKRLKWTAEKFCNDRRRAFIRRADVLRFGKDLVVQHGFTTNRRESNGLTTFRSTGFMLEFPR